MKMMASILYYFLYGLLKGLAFLPLRFLYVLADFIYFLLYRVAGYRKSVVRDNLKASFPEKKEEEILEIEKHFYHNFADYIVETIKLLHISDQQMAARFHFENLDIIERLISEGKSLAIYFSHCGNWEWAPSVTLHLPHTEDGRKVDFCQVYRPLKSVAFDRLMLKVRSRFGSLSLSKEKTFRNLVYFKREGLITVTGFMSDQKPSHGDPTEVVWFLNHPTAFITGTERLARQMQMGAVYWDVYKPSRGNYVIKCRLIAGNVADTEQGSVTRTYAGMLEKTIRRNPPIWLWTHKRWKIPVSMPLSE